MTSRERLQATLDHREPDRLCVDFGAGFQTGMGAGAVHRLRQALLGRNGHVVKIIEPYQMLGEIDEELRQVLGLDVVGVHGPGTMFGFKTENWKPLTLFDGTPVLVPGAFNVTPAEDGGWLMHPEGDTGVPRHRFWRRGAGPCHLDEEPQGHPRGPGVVHGHGHQPRLHPARL
jgi:hypothetical protein